MNDSVAIGEPWYYHPEMGRPRSVTPVSGHAFTPMEHMTVPFYEVGISNAPVLSLVEIRLVQRSFPTLLRLTTHL